MVASSRPQRFPKKLRLRSRAEFLAVQNRGIKLHVSHFLVFAIRASCAETTDVRIGITVTRKVGNAVFRNRIKRWVREAFRRERLLYAPGWDFVFVAKRQCVNADYVSVLRDVKNAGRQVTRKCKSSQVHPSRSSAPR